MARPPRPCSKCPAYTPGYCPVRAVRLMPGARSCEYGRRLMDNPRLAAKMKAGREEAQDERPEG